MDIIMYTTAIIPNDKWEQCKYIGLSFYRQERPQDIRSDEELLPLMFPNIASSTGENPITHRMCYSQSNAEYYTRMYRHREKAKNDPQFINVASDIIIEFAPLAETFAKYNLQEIK